MHATAHTLRGAAAERGWTTTRPSRPSSRCCVRVAAFNEPLRKPAAKSAAPAPVDVPPAPTASTVTLTLERVHLVSPATLAASLLEYSKGVNALEAAFSSAPAGDHVLYTAVARRVAAHVADFDAESLVSLLTAFGRAGQGRGNRDMLAIATAALAARMDELPPSRLADLAAACAALELAAPDMLTALCAQASEPAVLPRFSRAELVGLLGSLATLRHRAPCLFADAADVLATELQLPPQRSLSASQAVQAVWALAAADLYHRQLFDGAGALLMRQLRSLDGSSMARIAWAYATVRYTDESHRALWDRDLFDSIASVCLERGVSGFPPRALVTLLWAFASIPHYDAPLFDALGAALTPQLRACPPADLTAIAWAVQRVGHGNVGLMAALGDAALGALERLDGDDLTTIALAFPAAKAYNERFFKYLVDEAMARPQFFGQVALLDIIRLVGRVQHRDPAYYGAALTVLLDNVHQAFLDAPVEKHGCMNPYRFG